MTTRTIAVNRTAVGLIALSCLAAAIGLIFVIASMPDNSSLVFLQGGLARVGLLMGAIWLALPGRNQEAAWANFSPRTVVGLLLAILLTTRIQMRVLIPAAVVIGIVLLVLRPRPKKRPAPMRETPVSSG